jgi:hypothetical protein
LPFVRSKFASQKPNLPRTSTPHLQQWAGTLFPIEHKHTLGPALTEPAHGHRQGLHIRRKLYLPGAADFAFEFVGDFPAALVLRRPEDAALASPR